MGSDWGFENALLVEIALSRASGAEDVGKTLMVDRHRDGDDTTRSPCMYCALLRRSRKSSQQQVTMVNSPLDFVTRGPERWRGGFDAKHSYLRVFDEGLTSQLL